MKLATLSVRLLFLSLALSTASCKSAFNSALKSDTTSDLDARDYYWNRVVPEKKPAPEKSNGKLVLFDNSHMNSVGNSDWVIDGGFSKFADALVEQGYTVREYRGVDKNNDGIITFFDDRKPQNIALNEAILDWDALKDAAVFVIPEPNRPYTKSEYAILKRFVDEGKGIYAVCDHYNADRNMNTWDCTEVFNGYNRSPAPEYNLDATFGGDAYGDMRNPQAADKGWLAETFGLRFRFNSADLKSGATGIVPPNEAEGLTTGVEPILMASGATLAIVNSNIAKGIVYFKDTDPVKSASKSGDPGLYFGGMKEGPYVAISKPSKGKAAFIGDSSPIENPAPKYMREDKNKKSIHPGWVSRGTAAQLSINIVNWLATTEDYVGFAESPHTKGIDTPEPMAEVEKNIVNPEPWATPSFDPWDPATYAPGAYGAKRPAPPQQPKPPVNPNKPPVLAGTQVAIKVTPIFTYQDEPFAITVTSDGPEAEIGIYMKSNGQQVGNIFINNAWQNSNGGYLRFPVERPLLVKADRVTGEMMIRARLTKNIVWTQPIGGIAKGGFGWLVGSIPETQPGDLVAITQGETVIGTSIVDAEGKVRIAGKAGNGYRITVYGEGGVARFVSLRSYEIGAGQEVPL